MTGKAQHLKALEQKEAQRRLSKEEILHARIFEKTVDVKSLGGEVVLRSLSHRKRQEMRSLCLKDGEWDEEKFNDLVMAASFVEPEMTLEDIDTLKDSSSTVWDELTMHITMLNMLGQTEDLKKD
jgi:hypothetical protein